MKAKMFEELLDSVREGGAILRSEEKPSRCFFVQASGVSVRIGPETEALKPHPAHGGPICMSDTSKPLPTQPDAGLAAEQRPRPSQAEGDEETVEQDLAQKEQTGNKS